MKSPWMLLGVVTFGVLALTAVRVGAQAVNRPARATMVRRIMASDAGTRIITVKSRVVGDQAPQSCRRSRPAIGSF
jgi:hypothetical protein